MRRPPRHDRFGRAALAIAAYLESEGYAVVLFSGSRVQRRQSSYEFVLQFTGELTTNQATRGGSVPGSQHGDLPQRAARVTR